MLAARPFMLENVIMEEKEVIREHMEALRAKSESEWQSHKDFEAKMQEQNERVDEMLHLAGRFATWASRHGIPYDCYKGKFKTKGRWELGRTVPAADDEKGSYEVLEVDKHGEIDTGYWHNEVARRNAEDGKILRIGPGGVYRRIAGLCLEHGLEWDE
jgi:hypothetical protein